MPNLRGVLEPMEEREGGCVEVIRSIHLSPGTCLGRHLEGAAALVDTTSADLYSGDLVKVLTRY
jgi:hypothetical protein